MPKVIGIHLRDSDLREWEAAAERERLTVVKMVRKAVAQYMRPRPVAAPGIEKIEQEAIPERKKPRPSHSPKCTCADCLEAMRSMQGRI